MPKRKAESTHTADESPPAKKKKKSLEPKERGQTKGPKFKAISSNWKALSKVNTCWGGGRVAII